MHPVAYFIIAFGGFLAVTGILLFHRRGAEGTNSLKLLGFEFSLAGSSLVVFVLGVVLIMLPFIRKDDFPAPTPGDVSQSPREASAPPRSLDEETPAEAGRTAARIREAQLFFRRAGELWESGSYRDPALALQYYTEAIRLHPEGDQSYRLRAKVQLQLGNPVEALADLATAIELAPNQGEHYNERGAVYWKIGQISNACRDWNRAASLGDSYAIRNLREFGC